MLAEVLAITLHHLFGHHGAVFHRQNAEKGREGLRQLYLEGCIIQSLESRLPLLVALHLLENPRAGRGHVGVQNARETVHKVLGHDLAGRLVWIGLGVVEGHIIAKKEGVGQTVIRNGPAFGDGGHDVQRVVHIHQAVVELVAGPHHRLARCESGVKSLDTLGLVIVEDLLVWVVILGPATCKQEERSDQKP